MISYQFDGGRHELSKHTSRYLKTNTSDVVKQVQESHNPVANTVNGKVQAIVQDPLSYQKTQDQLTMLRILAHGRKQVEEGKVTHHDHALRGTRMDAYPLVLCVQDTTELLPSAASQ